MSSSLSYIVVSAKQLEESHHWQLTLHKLILLMDPAEMSKYRAGISLNVAGRPEDPPVREYFKRISSFFALWPYFISRDDSLEFIVRALCSPDGMLDQERVRAFYTKGVTVTTDYCMRSGIECDSDEFAKELLDYLRERKLLVENA